MSDARLTRLTALAGVQETSDARLVRMQALAGVQETSDARLVRMQVLVAWQEPPNRGVTHGHRTPLSLGRR